MEAITKKRLKAIIVDSLISTGVSMGIEYFLRKKYKNEAFYATVLPYATQCTLEYVQLKRNGQTIGYKLMGLELESEDGSDLKSEQIFKRMVHRDTTSTLAYLKDRKGFEGQGGALLPHDERTGTIVKEVD